MACVAAIWFAAQPAAAADAPKPGDKAAKITYADHVRPIFREHCFNCHNSNKAQNDLALDNYERVRKGGASGEAVQPGDADGSYLYAVMSHKEEPRMPPNRDKIPAAQLEIIRQWILGGALKDSGSTAKIVKPPAAGLAVPVTVGTKGTVIMPEGLPQKPIVVTPRAAAVTAIATAPWSPLVAVAGQQQIVLYHADNGQLLGILPFPEGIPYVLKFSRSGALLLAGGGKSASRGLVAVYDVRTGKRLFEVGDELDAVLGADVNASQSLVALGGPERLIRIFSTADGTRVQEIRKHNDWVYAVEFSPDGVLLATADRAGGLLVWEADTAREFYNLEGHKDAVTDVSWRSDSNVLASASADGSIKLWNMENGRLLKSMTAHPGGVSSIQFARDGRLASAGRDRQVKLWGPGGNLLRTFQAFAEPCMKVAITHDGSRVIAGDWSGEIRLWNAADGKRITLLPSNPTGTQKSGK